MKKRFLSLLTALCLTLSLAPAALAVETGDNLVGDQIAADVSGETAALVEEPSVPSEEEPAEDPLEQSTVPDEAVTVPVPDTQAPTALAAGQDAKSYEIIIGHAQNKNADGAELSTEDTNWFSTAIWEDDDFKDITETKTAGETVTLTKPTNVLTQYDSAGNKVATWACTKYQVAKNDETAFGDEGTATYTVSADDVGKRGTIRIFYLWDRTPVSQHTITYNFNKGEIGDATIYPVVDTFQVGVAEYFEYANPDLNIEENKETPYITTFFSKGGTGTDYIRYAEDVKNSKLDESTEFSYENFSKTYPEDGSFAVASGLAQLRMPALMSSGDHFRGLPIVNFIARSGNAETGYTYYQLTGWKVTDTPPVNRGDVAAQAEEVIVEPGEVYTVTGGNKTFTAQWKEADLTVSEEVLPAPILTTYSDTETEIKLSQKQPNDTAYSTGSAALDEKGMIDYRVSMTPNQQVFTGELMGWPFGDYSAYAPYFKPLNNSKVAAFTVNVNLNGLELATDAAGNSTITIANSLLKPTGTVKVGAQTITGTVDADISKGIATLKVNLSGASVFSIAMEGDVTRYERRELPTEEMTLDFSAKAKDGAKSFSAQVSLEGKINLSQASTSTNTDYVDWTETDQLIRYVLGDDAWRAKYAGDNKKLEIVETLQAAKDLEAALKEPISATSNTLTTSPSVIPATGITLDKNALTLYVDEQAKLTATVTPASSTDKITWSTDNAEVATVDEYGTVTAHRRGEATITATVGGHTASCRVEVSRRSSGGDSYEPSGDYIVSVDKTTGGKVTVNPGRADKGDTVTITVKPDKGYELDELTVTDKSGDTIKIKDKGNGKFTFTMPGSKVTVEASFKLIETEPEAPVFADVPADAYYADAVAWAVKEGITSGTSATTFSPNASCTRAQMVTFLWRANGSPKATGVNPFTDVSADAYYYNAVLWAAEKGITAGTSATTFSPDAVLTRSQTVTFLWRAAGSPVVNYAMNFADVNGSAYYGEAVRWAVSEGITAGTGGNNFSPDAPCTRAQIMTFMYRDAQ